MVRKGNWKFFFNIRWLGQIVNNLAKFLFGEVDRKREGCFVDVSDRSR